MNARQCIETALATFAKEKTVDNVAAKRLVKTLALVHCQNRPRSLNPCRCSAQTYFPTPRASRGSWRMGRRIRTKISWYKHLSDNVAKPLPPLLVV